MRFIPWLIFLTWLFIAFNIVDFIGYCWGDPVVERLSVSGLLLELAGLFLVFVGIGGRLKAWGETTLLARIYRFLWKLFRQDVVVHLGTGELKGQAGEVTVSGYGTVTPPGDLTLQQQVDALRAKVLQMQKEFADRFERLEERQQKDIAELSKLVRRIEHSLTEQVKALEVKVKNTDVGGADMEYVGLLWVGIGLIVATLPEWVEEHIRAPLQFNWVQSVYSLLCG